MKNIAIISLYSFIKGGDRYMNTILTRNNILVSLAITMLFSLIMMVQTVAFMNKEDYNWREVSGGHK